MLLEAATRKEIDTKFEAAGWAIQDKKCLNLYASPGVAFRQNLVSDYIHEVAVVYKVNVGYDIYRIQAKLTEQANKIEAGTAVEIRGKGVNGYNAFHTMVRVA